MSSFKLPCTLQNLPVAGPVGMKQKRSRRDSNPRAGDKPDKLISSQPRYDHFDTTPYR